MARKMFGCRLEDSWHERAMAVVSRSGARSVQEWLEKVVQTEVVRSENAEGVDRVSDDLIIGASPTEALAAAKARIGGMEELIASQRERIADSQAHSIALQSEIDRLNEHLSAANANALVATKSVERMTFMLPAVAEDSHRESPGWRFWKNWRL